MQDETLYVIILNWNGEGVIAPCLESLVAIERPPMRIIVVDNASTDSSVEIVRNRFPGVELIVNDRNLLFAEGNNVGLRRAVQEGGRYFLLLNNDTVVDRHFAERLLDVLRSKPGAGIVGPKILYHDDTRRIWYGGGDFYPVIWIPRHLNIRRIDGTFPERVQETGYVSGCALLVRREVIEGIGYLDPSYRIYCEDVDFCLRAVMAGWKCYYEPAALVWHKISSSSGGGFTAFKLENRLISTYRLFAVFKPLWWRIVLFPIHLAGFIVLLAGLFLSGKWGLLKGALRGVSVILRGG